MLAEYFSIFCRQNCLEKIEQQIQTSVIVDMPKGASLQNREFDIAGIGPLHLKSTRFLPQVACTGSRRQSAWFLQVINFI